ncbi:LysR family transcriptional regulator [Planomonospora venezuelensis]|uniref:DNA-binding transcriptional LysR family regulator n=1 Tax=Planomonospora venezuelensis TaxID=1999 RepID=A0A841D8C0_PLAVE|nr:LysR substrate-binding domain-containing protein [Planomonospora venezuelensis]MBB5963656.1 DNA-binding transcriptional LysR family regulator [Planomonospora venezuelensis]GIN01444.1 transcriptional regulator, LysR family protein [Planomonospora venezuelensis]
MPVDLRLMRYVVTIAEEGGFQRAAERLRMAQPPLSRQILELERHLGVSLFHRRPTRLTEAGEVFVASARRVLADADAMVERARAAGRGESGTVRLGMVASAAHETVPEVLAALRPAHPDVVVRAHEAWSGELAAGLRAGRFDLVLGRTIPRRPGLARQTVRREPLVAVVGPAHPLAGRPAAALSDLYGSRLRLVPGDVAPDYRDMLLATLARTGLEFEVDDCQVLGWRHLGLDDGKSFALVPGSLGALPTADGVVLPLTDRLPAPDLELVWRRDALPPAGAAFTRVVEATARERGWLETAPGGRPG